MTKSLATPSALSCFVIGPLGDGLAPLGTEERAIYEAALEVRDSVIEPACSEVGLSPQYSHTMAEPGEITEQICTMLRDADIVIADVTGGNPNVMYELGLRHTINRATVQVGEYGRLPFDISVIRTVRFSRTESGLVRARTELIEKLRAALENKFTPVTATRVFAWVKTIAPTAEGDRVESTEEKDGRGFLEMLAEMEEALAELQRLMAQITVTLQELNRIYDIGTRMIKRSDARGSGFAGRAKVARDIARLLSRPAETLEALALSYESEVERVGPGMAVLLEALGREESSEESAKEFLHQITTLSELARENVVNARAFADVIIRFEQLSSALRVPARRIAAGTRRIASALETVARWRGN